MSRFPKQGLEAPWRVHQNYALDLMALRFGRLDDGVMRFGAGARGPARWCRSGGLRARGVVRLQAKQGLSPSVPLGAEPWGASWRTTGRDWAWARSCSGWPPCPQRRQRPAREASTSFGVAVVVRTVCRVELNSTPTVVSPTEIDLGQMTELCNDGGGYSVTLNTPPGLTGGTVVIAGRAPIHRSERPHAHRRREHQGGPPPPRSPARTRRRISPGHLPSASPLAERADLLA